ncbi:MULTISPECIES: 3'-5' exonuclease [unclassified Gilliamella]|uniref:3'-5' exonuclease n=1 Tax=unclassified Gilliamella TaxID=2685620 RepID=UPI00226A67D3|nr:MULTISPECIES: 3'-5' exonuclease [unclassified Gilliamella]MCX8574564.1 3'-5' exoribonuclease [Gilliamella sp. B3831]MCX8576795.1 3'-5' exoribonuclease [Gilliamella sp. B3815]MCX8589223.1 3'-5' exoribonuclease [Gilliamella sp. B3812]MCX8603797.1 3'-5' exoribonuclease [Gilliamella sp. B3823]MCX8606677.1 3'-5' exoribonuclease [Gilliamella sp. B3825]
MTINTVIIDIETLDTAPTAVILSIGAFSFNKFNLKETMISINHMLRSSEQNKNQSFYYNLHLLPQILRGRSISAETIDFWKNNDYSPFIGHSWDPRQALINLSKYLNDKLSNNDDVHLYFRGTSFDEAILVNAYKSLDLEVPWKFYNVRDIRTYIDALTNSNKGYIKDFKTNFNFTKHHALHDVLRDAEQMCVAYELNKTKY